VSIVKTIPTYTNRMGLVYSHSLKVGNRWVHRDDQITVKGHRGRLSFAEYVTDPETGVEWFTAYDSQNRARSFRPEQIRVVHRTKKPMFV
jgi:hypothetical protein